MENDALFLETTIIDKEFLGTVEEKEQINEIKSKFNDVYSSTYVVMEYNRTVLRDLFYLNNICAEATKISEVLEQINKLKYQNNKFKRCFQFIIQFFAKSEEKILNTDDKNMNDLVLDKIKTYFELIIPDAIDYPKSMSLVNETDCYNAKVIPKEHKGLYRIKLTNCDKNKIKCKINDFITNNKKSFECILSELKKKTDADNEQIKMRDAIENTLRNPDNGANKKNCWNCGDAIIAVECREDNQLFTTNIKHYNLICDAIGKKIITFN
ncbi:MAG: hypothetical protein A3J83_03300 [Elusimicrobia bacterium RIFOXYA2_FULL_40_6]|nr:MAG: hypothetical protein A3J83_03300 [Elusimicrobia bacterium RIFOXYA2_FULL_40_6]